MSYCMIRMRTSRLSDEKLCFEHSDSRKNLGGKFVSTLQTVVKSTYQNSDQVFGEKIILELRSEVQKSVSSGLLMAN